MKYINANEILPVRLVEELQEYMQAGYIYVPAKAYSWNLQTAPYPLTPTV